MDNQLSSLDSWAIPLEDQQTTLDWYNTKGP